MPTSAPQDPARRSRRERLWLALAVVLVGTGVVVGRYAELQALEANEVPRLTVQVTAIASNLEQQLQGIRSALAGVRHSLKEWPRDELVTIVPRRLDALSAALSPVHSMVLVDATGIVVAAGGSDGVVSDQSGATWFASVKARGDPEALIVAAPVHLPNGPTTLTLAMAVLDGQGRFDGAVAATLDAEYFNTLMASVIYAGDTSTRIVHGDGGLLVVVPPQALLLGVNAAQSGSMFSRHLASGQAVSVMRGPSLATGDARLTALLTLQPPALAMDKPLVLTVSRSIVALRAPWRQETALMALLWLGAASAAGVALWLVQRRRQDRELALAAEMARQAADAERLRLALRGGDLALWDLDVPSGRATINERWSTMLGYAPDDPAGASDAWPRLLHPDDRERVLALLQAHMDGHSESFEATYRLQHRNGHWITVLDRGRVVEREVSGRPLRMVGTHMDVSARVEADEAVKRSERSLAVTLQSIGDAVIATDAEGRITRINEAARRLTCWPGDSAIGRPLHEVFRILTAETREPAPDPVARVLASGAVVDLAYGTVLVARDGSERQVADSAALIRTEDGSVLGVVLVFSDVTGQYRMVQALRRSEQKSRALLDALRSGVVVHGPDSQVLDANPSACRILGLTLDQMRGKTAIDPSWAFLEEDGSPMAQPRFPVNQVLAGSDLVRDLVVGLRRPEMPAPAWTLCNAFALRDDVGALQEVVVTFYDITERKQANEALQRSAARLRLAGRLARLGGWALDLASAQVDLSAEAARVIGEGGGVRRPLDDLLRLVAPPQRAALDKALRGPEAFDLEVEARMPSGRQMNLRLMGEPVFDEQGRRVAMQGAVQDVTASRREQQQLLLLQTAVAQLNDMVVITAVGAVPDAEPTVVFVNDAFERLTGWRRDEVVGQPLRQTLPPHADPAALARLREALAGHEALRTELLRCTRDGRPYWVDIQIAPLCDADGRATHMVAVERDISDRHRTEAQAREAQAALAATLDAVPDLLFEIDNEGRVHNYHSPRSDLLLLPPEAFIHRRVVDFMPPDAATVIMQALGEAHAKGYTIGHPYSLTLKGEQRWFELSVARKASAPGELPRFIALARDISERRQGEAARLVLERQLREAQKIESLGTLSGGIAHDFNNILPAILGNIALARQDLPPEHPAMASLEQIQRAGLRARTLVQQILAFSRRQPHALVVQPLQPVLHETLALLRATLPAGVRLDTVITDAPTPVAVDATQLQQVLMNLCTNAWHALPDERGRIEVGLAEIDSAEAARLGGAGLAPGRCMHLWVADDGSGMDANTRERIFDPFFTTKPVGRGTGLGLSVVHGIVRGHFGSISVDSAPGRGSRFHVLLPLSINAPAAPDGSADAVAPASAGQGEAVWYVDDDPVMALMVQRLLQREGYEVAVFENGALALAAARAASGPPALVITDNNMPELSGLELAAQLRGLWPALPLVLSTGYVSDTLHAEAARQGVRALLHKENTLEELPVLVRRLVGAGPA